MLFRSHTCNASREGREQGGEARETAAVAASPPPSPSRLLLRFNGDAAVCCCVAVAVAVAVADKACCACEGEEEEEGGDGEEEQDEVLMRQSGVRDLRRVFAKCLPRIFALALEGEGRARKGDPPPAPPLEELRPRKGDSPAVH